MKTHLLSLLFLLTTLTVSATSESEVNTYEIEVQNLTFNSVEISWHRTDGSIDENPYYCVEYGIKGFERGNDIFYVYPAKIIITETLMPDTEYSFYVRHHLESEESPVWFEEYTFKTLACNTEISNIKEEMEYANGILIKDLVDVHISCDYAADFYELEYRISGIENITGTILTSTKNRISIGNENLQSDTEYDYYIRAKCNDVYGEWSEKGTFTTTTVFHYAPDETFEVYFENITHKSAWVKWRRLKTNFQSNGHQIEYGPKGFERGTGQSEWRRDDQYNYYYLSELMPDTEYSFFVRSDDNSIESPVWFVEHSFKTLPCNAEISGIKAMEMHTTCECHNGAVAVFVEWDDTADSYELEYGLKGFEKGMGEIITEEGYSGIVIPFEKLESYTDYDFYIRAKCDGDFGEWTDVNSFSTTKLHTSIESVQIPNLNIYPNPVENILYIDFDSNYDITNINVTIFDLNGIVQYKFKYQYGYDISSLSAGQYIVNVTDKRLSKTMIIQKK